MQMDTTDTTSCSSLSIEYVIARYAEDLDWLLQPPFASPDVKVSIYNKGRRLQTIFLSPCRQHHFR
jgi:hypothetical protein